MKYSINLLTGKETPFAERVMYFFLNYLRYIIIITQLVVIGVFFYRFQIDQRIIDLKESVDQKKEIIQVVVPLINEAEAIDNRSRQAVNIIKSQQKFNFMLQYFLSQFPDSIHLANLEITPGAIKATGKTSDPKQLQEFYAVLKKDNKFAIIELENLRKSDSGFSFVLNLTNFKDSL